jgi:hypothetical protein
MLNTVMLRDLQCMNERGAGQLNGRATTDQDVLAEMAFRDSHRGMSRAEYAERQRQWARNDFEESATSDLDSEPPGVSIMSSTPQRARWDRYLKWRAAEAVKLSELEQKRAELLGLKSAPAATESRIQALVRKTADYLLGKSDDGGDELDRKGLDERLAIERHRAQAVDLLLPDIDRQIEIAKLRVKRLQQREAEFLRLALVERAEQFVPDYLKAIERLRKAVAPLAAMNVFFGGDGVNIKLPTFGLDALERAGTRIQKGDATPWHEFAESLGATPADAAQDGFYIVQGRN